MDLVLMLVLFIFLELFILKMVVGGDLWELIWGDLLDDRFWWKVVSNLYLFEDLMV
jgi:hypothetical protein